MPVEIVIGPPAKYPARKLKKIALTISISGKQTLSESCMIGNVEMQRLNAKYRKTIRPMCCLSVEQVPPADARARRWSSPWIKPAQAKPPSLDEEMITLLIRRVHDVHDHERSSRTPGPWRDWKRKSCVAL
jgi:hypothetical protein